MTASTIPTLSLNRRSFHQFVGLMALGANSWAAAPSLPNPSSLADELASALQKSMPLMVMVSLEGCPFCKVVREHYLLPLMREEHVPIVQINMRDPQVLLDFERKSQTQASLITRWNVSVAPTVLFFGRHGAEVAERLVGGSIPDYYGAYLDDRLKLARAAVRASLTGAAG
ncbi:MAG: hypothetical protein FD135_3088 [Comamonadaceae bacterium]|nr:MAG: hypothetical protein FD135_3088 [Comamonadaceae bacterium]